ncbi:MAG: hypothetical protein HKN39_02235 [Flavobacteriales bacterium]|nr:hypothetical protein [Flavobacteriales bacterium]
MSFTISGQFSGVEWFKTIGALGDEEITDFVIDGEGNFILTGSYSNTTDLEPGQRIYELTAISGKDNFIIEA